MFSYKFDVFWHILWYLIGFNQISMNFHDFHWFWTYFDKMCDFSSKFSQFHQYLLIFEHFGKFRTDLWEICQNPDFTQIWTKSVRSNWNPFVQITHPFVQMCPYPPKSHFGQQITHFVNICPKSMEIIKIHCNLMKSYQNTLKSFKTHQIYNWPGHWSIFEIF